jgi:NADPH2:quinone reductase
VLLVADQYQVHVDTPFVPGSELAGVVSEVGADVRGVSVGDRVTGTLLVGAFAEEAVVPETSLRPVPDGVDFATAAASGVAHRTAHHVLRSTARLQVDERLVVLGAGGGVGLAAVQLGVRLGAEVTAVASSAEKLAAAKACGATHLIDHTAGDLKGALTSLLPDGSDVVIDPVGGDLAEPALRSLRYGGRFVTVGYASGAIPKIPLNLVMLKGIQIRGFQFLTFAQHHPDELARNDTELDGWLASGEAAPHIGARFTLGATAEALALVATGQAVGKVVVEIASLPGR